MSLTVECILRILPACGLGGAIGFERSKRLKGAGVRTHCIIAAAAVLIYDKETGNRVTRGKLS